MARVGVLLAVSVACGRVGFEEPATPTQPLFVGGSASGGGISNTTGISAQPHVELAGGVPMVVWADGSSGNAEIYLERYDGSTWQSVAGSAGGGGVSRSLGQSGAPAVAVDGDDIWVAWHDDADGVFQIYLRQYDGNDWVEVLGSASGGGVSNTTGDSGHPALAVAAGTVALAWHEGSGPSQIFVRCFDGNEWRELANSASGGGVSNTGGNSWSVEVAMREACQPILTWHDHGGGAAEIYVAHYDGVAWRELHGSASTGGVSNNAGESYNPTLALDSAGEPVVAWGDDTSGIWQIHAARHTASGWQRLTGTDGLSATPGESWLASVAVDNDDRPVVAWHDDSIGNPEIYLRRLDGGEWLGIDGSAEAGGLSNNPGGSWLPSLVVDGERVIVSWQDDSSGTSQIYLLVHDDGWRELNR